MSNQNTKNYKNKILGILDSYFNIVAFFSLVLILILGFIFVINPKKESITVDLKKIRDEKQVKKSDLEKLRNKISLYKRSYLSVDENVKKKLEKMIPSEAGADELILEMESLIKDRGLSLESLIIQEAVPKKAVSRDNKKVEVLPAQLGQIDISLSLQGINYKSLKDLLEILEKNLRIMDIKLLGFSPGDTALKLEIATYYKK